MSKKTTSKKTSSIDILQIINDINLGNPLKRSKNIFYQNNINLLKYNMLYYYTNDELNEWSKCKNDPIYFIKEYCKVIPFKFQEEIIKNYVNYRFNIFLNSREIGFTTILSCLILWELLFNNKNISILNDKLLAGIEIIEKIKHFYIKLPYFFKSKGISSWSKKLIKIGDNFVNFNFNLIYADILFISDAFDISEERQKQTIMDFSTLMSHSTSKVIISGTPKLGSFYNMVQKSELPYGNPLKSVFKVTRSYWWQVPNRGKEWVEDKIKVVGEELFYLEYDMKFGNK
jgi:hypothetical protein